MLVCSQNDISLRSGFACLFSHFYCIQVFNYMCWLKLLASYIMWSVRLVRYSMSSSKKCTYKMLSGTK